MKKLKYKKGSSVATMPIVLLTCMIFIIIIGTLIINKFMPFLWYQKLQNVMQKYMFVIEKFGYLTQLEKSQLYNELGEKGFDTSNIFITAPVNQKQYGELINFKITYKYKNKQLVLKNGIFKLKEETTPICIDKYSYSKK